MKSAFFHMFKSIIGSYGYDIETFDLIYCFNSLQNNNQCWDFCIMYFTRCTEFDDTRICVEEFYFVYFSTSIPKIIFWWRVRSIGGIGHTLFRITKKNFEIYFNFLYCVSVLENTKVECDCICYVKSFFGGVRGVLLYCLLRLLNENTLVLKNIGLSILQLKLLLSRLVSPSCCDFVIIDIILWRCNGWGTFWDGNVIMKFVFIVYQFFVW